MLICTDYSVEEVTCGIVCGCLTAFPAFIRHIADIKNKVTKAARGRSNSPIRCFRLSTRHPIPKALISSERSTVLSPSLRNISAHNSGKFVTPVTAGLGNGKKKRYDQWAELDELEYVAGDDERYVTTEPSIVQPRRPPPVLSQEELKDVRLDHHRL